MLGLGNLWRSESRAALRQVALAAACVLCGMIAFAALCFAGFVVAWERFGLVNACLAAALVFFVAALLLGAAQAALVERRRRRRHEAIAAAAPLAALADPRALLLGLQIAQTIGLKRVAPLLAIGVAAFAFGASRRGANGRRARRVARREDAME